MPKESPNREHDVSAYRKQTEWRLVLGGFAIAVVVGGAILWLFFGQLLALIAVGIALVTIALFALLLALLRALEAWAKSE